MKPRGDDFTGDSAHRNCGGDYCHAPTEQADLRQDKNSSYNEKIVLKTNQQRGSRGFASFFYTA
jgi:hypothetical protein